VSKDTGNSGGSDPPVWLSRSESKLYSLCDPYLCGVRSSTCQGDSLVPGDSAGAETRKVVIFARGDQSVEKSSVEDCRDANVQIAR